MENTTVNASNWTSPVIDHPSNSSSALHHSAPVTAFLLTLISTLSTITTAANLTAIVSFCQDRRLRITQNIYIINLAIADFLIGCVVTPLAAVTTLYHPAPFTHWECKVKNALDYWASTHSVLATALISYDRCMIVADAALYRDRQTRCVAIRNCVVCAIISFLCFSPAILLWNVGAEDTGEGSHSLVEPGVCDTDVQFNEEYTVVFGIICFVLPLAVILYCSTRVLLYIRAKGNLSKSNTAARNHVGEIGVANVTALGHSDESSSSTDNVNRQDFKRIVKTTRTLAALILAFLVCWCPYSVVSIVQVFSKSTNLGRLYYASFWIQYYNSLLNPFIYPLTNERFRRNYVRIWHTCCCFCRR